MKKLMRYGVVLAAACLTGCTSYVRVFDGADKPIRSCMVTKMLFSGSAASCQFTGDFSGPEGQKAQK